MQSLVRAQIKSENPLKIGPDNMRPMISLGTFMERVGDETKEFRYLNEHGKTESNFIIEGTRHFDLSDTFQAHNWKTLQLDVLCHPDLAEQLLLVDPGKEADDALLRYERQVQLTNIILDRRTDSEFLAKLHRHVISSASGLPAKVVVKALLDKANEDVDAFMSNGNWFFEGQYFETEALLDLSLERGIILRDGDNFMLSSDKVMFADSRAKAIYKLQEEAGFRHSVQRAVNVPLLDATPSPVKVFETSEMLELASAVGKEVDQPGVNEDGSIDLSGEGQKDQTRLVQLVVDLISANIVSEKEDGSVEMLEANLKFNSREELVGHLKTNQTNAEWFAKLLSD